MYLWEERYAMYLWEERYATYCGIEICNVFLGRRRVQLSSDTVTSLSCFLSTTLSLFRFWRKKENWFISLPDFPWKHVDFFLLCFTENAQPHRPPRQRLRTASFPSDEWRAKKCESFTNMSRRTTNRLSHPIEEDGEEDGEVDGAVVALDGDVVAAALGEDSEVAAAGDIRLESRMFKSPPPPPSLSLSLSTCSSCYPSLFSVHVLSALHLFYPHMFNFIPLINISD